MANERKTESIIRDHFNKYKDSLIIEEQSSDSPIIDKLLKLASKKGDSEGHPEFIIQFKQNSDLLIVIECKADYLKHESKDRNKYDEYAVDGVLLYASYLAKSFDVLAIAISGESQEKLKVSHFLLLKGNNQPIQKFGSLLLPPTDYLEGY